MKVLWTVNVIFPFPAKELKINASPFGGWLLGLYDIIKSNEDVELCILTSYKGKNLKKIIDGRTTYYMIPCFNPERETKKLTKLCKKVCDDFKPDIIHIHGTEYAYGRIFQKFFDTQKIIISIQGLTSICSNYYLANLRVSEILRNPTLRNLLTGSIITTQNNLYKRGRIEKKIIENASVIIGRTTFDYANTAEFSPYKKYYLCNESLRNAFYDRKWDIQNIKRHSIYFSQGGNPLKGLHIVLEALNILKIKYPDIKLYITGKNVFEFNNIFDYIKFSNYQKIISGIIKKYNLTNYIEFLGIVGADYIADILTKCNLFVQASSIENSSNALGEAMLVGTPCVASYVGGTADMIKNGTEGLLYPFGDYGLLAHCISKVFDDDKLAIKLSNNAKEHAKKTHDREKNATTILNIYKEVNRF